VHLEYLSLLLFAASIWIFRWLPLEFIPAQDRGVLFVVFQAPEGKSIHYTLEKVEQFERLALQHPGVRRIYTAVGGFGQGGQGNRGNGVVLLKDRQQHMHNQLDVAHDLRAAVKGIQGARVFIRDRFGSNIGGRRGSPVEFTISGPDPDQQKKIYQQFKQRMDADTSIVGTRSDDVLVLPEVHIVPNRDKAIASGVEIAEIAATVNSTFGGVVAGQYTKDGRRFDIFVQLREQDRQTTGDISKVLVRNNRGETLPLAQVVDIEQTEGPQIVFRENRQRGVRVDASLSQVAKLGDVVKKIRHWSEEILPERYLIRFSATPQEKLLDIIVVMLLGLIVAYMILASQFNSFVDPLIVFLAIPFGLVGSAVALLLAGQTLHVYSAIGILLTMGIVMKNSILLVEFTNQLRDRGQDLHAALTQACDIRLRPILMTNMATVAAAIPPALSLGAGSEVRIPMALTVIGGVLLSALFTLVVVPCAYSLVAPKRIKVLEEK